MIAHNMAEQAPAFLLFGKDPFAVDDLSRTIAEQHPTSRIVASFSVEEALSLIETMPEISMAFIHLAPEQVAVSPLGQALASRGARIVLMGDDAEERGQAAGFDVLVRPFNTADVIFLMRERRIGG